jgi:translation initiation factor 1 (eIF-1/SUI1)
LTLWFRKGALKPIQVVVKIRQGRKASTLVSGFESFAVLSGEEMAEDLRKICASATSGIFFFLSNVPSGPLITF